MAAPATPQNFYVQQANNTVYLLWNQSTGATSYLVQRSQDNVTFTTIATVTGTPLNNFYLDTTATPNTQYYYQVAASNISGTSAYTTPQGVVPCLTGTYCLAQVRVLSQQRADRLGSNFVTLPEWNNYITQSYFELYDLLVDLDEDRYMAPPVFFTTTSGNTNGIYPIPDGSSTFQDSNGNNIIPPPMYRLKGLDLALNSASNAYMTVDPFQFIERNRFVYPNTGSTLYGVFNMRYRWVGNNLFLIPTPSAGQKIRLWYIPRLQQPLQETDLLDGVSGWLEYVIVDAAIKALQKEESDTMRLSMQKQALIQRIQDSATDRDVGRPDSISDVRQSGYWGSMSGGYGWPGPVGGFALLPPIAAATNFANHHLTHAEFFSQRGLTYIALVIALSYLFNLRNSKFGSGITFARIRNFISSRSSHFFSHIRHIIKLGSNKKMSGIDTLPVVAPMTNQKTIRDITINKEP